MPALQVVCYLIGIILLVLAAFGVLARVSLALLGAAFLALGFTLPTLAAVIH